MYGRFFGTHNTCIFYTIEMATRLHATYLGMVCNYAFQSMRHTGLLLHYQQNIVTCEIILFTVSMLLKWQQDCMLLTFDGLQLHVKK